MNSTRSIPVHSWKCLFVIALFALCPALCFSQVSPDEIAGPDLKALEQTYFQHMIGINQSVAKPKFPYPLCLSRYVGLDPSKQAEADARGLGSVRFHGRTTLKVIGNYNAADNTLRMTEKERSAATFRSVVLTLLGILTATLPEDLACD